MTISISKMNFGKVSFLILLTISLVNCSDAGISQNKETSTQDTINIKTSYGDKEYCLSGQRLFPNASLSDEEAFNLAEQTKIFLIIEKNDTLFVLSGRELFSENLNENNYLPPINDSTIKDYYSKKYEISRDTDPPHWTAIENQKDSIIVRLGNDDVPQWIEGNLTDSIFEFSDGLKIGITKSDFFKLQGIDFLYEKSDFTILFTSFFESNVSWYFSPYCSKHDNTQYCKPDGFHIKSSLKYFLTFKNNRLVSIKLHE
jgi:hypothetical protein